MESPFASAPAKLPPDHQSCQDLLVRSGPANPDSTTCSTCLEEISNDEQVYQHTVCGGCWHEECFRSWLNDKCTCPHCRACVRKGIHPTGLHSYIIQNDLGYRSPEWKEYWLARRKQIKKSTTLGISFWRLKPGYTQQERFHKYVQQALKIRRRRYRRALSRLADSDAYNKYRTYHDLIEMAEDSCATTIRSARELLEQQKSLSSRAAKWEATPPDPYTLPPLRHRDIVADLELENQP